MRIAYNYALALQQIGQYPVAEAVLKKIHSVVPEDPDMVYALVTLYAQQSKWDLALTHGADGPSQIYAEIKSKLYSK